MPNKGVLDDAKDFALGMIGLFVILVTIFAAVAVGMLLMKHILGYAH
jgi:hypothetical protein